MAKWKVDLAHSTVGFEVKHMMVSKVKGTFDAFTVNVEAEDLADLTGAQIDVSIDTASISTRNEERDGHLKSADFFDVENYPTITFKSTAIEKSGDDYKVTGDLTIKDQTHPVTLEVEYGGSGTNPWGVQVYGFEGKGKVDREQFGLTWNAALETGGVLVGKEIKLKLELEFNPEA